MAKLILLRHGKSVWNKKNIFSGWVDIPLAQEGVEEAIRAGKSMASLNVDEIYTSELIRAQMTAFIVMSQSGTSKVPCVQHKEGGKFDSWYKKGATGEEFIPAYIAWELNERMYGDLQGKNKAKTIEEHGADQVQLWRRSYRIAPPGGETLEDTAKRSIPFFQNTILNRLKEGKDVFVCAHGNSLRSIVMHIENLSEEEVLKLEIATGVLRIYEYKEGSFSRV
jgi:2,3-bisphosphoglycerate-dependent phosphoglycerate mutase